jgi:hypothetical protein
MIKFKELKRIGWIKLMFHLEMVWSFTKFENIDKEQDYEGKVVSCIFNMLHLRCGWDVQVHGLLEFPTISGIHMYGSEEHANV